MIHVRKNLQPVFNEIQENNTGRTKLSAMKQGLNLLLGRVYGINYKGDQKFAILYFGNKIDSPAVNRDYSHAIASVERTHEFKHSNRTGRKWWTSHRGIDLYFVIPVYSIEVYHRHGHSWPYILINEKLFGGISVSGGTGNSDCDWVDLININRPIDGGYGLGVRELNLINEAALDRVSCVDLGIYADVVKMISESVRSDREAAKFL